MSLKGKTIMRLDKLKFGGNKKQIEEDFEYTKD
jgi:hypothetical protein